MSQREAKIFFQAFRDHKPCPILRVLDISNNKLGDGGVVHLAEAVEAGALKHLQDLRLIRVGIRNKGFKGLVKAIVAQPPNTGCPRLEELYAGLNGGIGDRSVMYLAEAMKKEGALQQLREMELNGAGVGFERGIALFQALKDTSVCPSLRWMIVRVVDEDMCWIVKEVEMKRRHDSRCSRLELVTEQ